jgi:hypothetical protein
MEALTLRSWLGSKNIQLTEKIPGVKKYRYSFKKISEVVKKFQ